MTLFSLADERPRVSSDAYIAPNTVLIGDVRIGSGSSVWPQAVLRGDNDAISIGDGSNIQDGAVVHADPGHPVDIGNNVSVGHACVLHGCRVGSGTLIGIHATILNDAYIPEGCIVGANALITEGKVFPPRSLIIGSPAKAVRQLTGAEIQAVLTNAKDYESKAVRYKEALQEI
ncbi:hexapeptide repeat-containing transferase [Caballeronia turbans]|jgi:carbonic anhydrase/acetyltransferase-like protein (isoleucine patch superfamily)|uniref:gamma carbonic anhydrase family protein n=1 Tax=unclassified Caballeronia TaxID=2646786 RepID=UPI00074C96BE|nr:MULTISPECIES: gamma carbonic anhydrase family protein [unclassified Caballeronia]SAL61483.1 hexapeptide repeat-containing transferase [Caballeronia turbans]